MVLTEAIEGIEYPEDHPNEAAIIHNQLPERHASPGDNLPPINYPLELIESPDGSLYWVE